MPKTDKVKVKITADAANWVREMQKESIWPKLAESLCEEQDTDRKLT